MSISYKHKAKGVILLFTGVLLMSACGSGTPNTPQTTEKLPVGENTENMQTRTSEYTETTKVSDVINDPVFGEYGRLIFPVDMEIDEDLELKDVNTILPWYSEVNPAKTVEIVNYMKEQASNGEQIFYDIYSDAEKRADPEKENTGIFFFRGNTGAKTAIVNAGGGFMYVAGIHDSFPQALELAKNGYNAWIGVCMLLLFIGHHIMNRRWIAAVRKGRYTAIRIIQTLLVVIMLCLMLGSMISGIVLSNHVFKALQIAAISMEARQVHIFCAYWGFVVMSVHISSYRFSLEYDDSKNQDEACCFESDCDFDICIWSLCIL